MLSKNYVSVMAAIIAGTFIFVTSCQKNVDVSPAALSNPGGHNPTTGITPSGNNFYTITSHDGHTIGINGQPSSTKNPDNTITGCGAASGLTVQVASGVHISTGSIGCELFSSWVAGGGACVALYINGKQFIDCTTGNGLWSPAYNGITTEGWCIPGGIQAGETFNNFVRTYCNSDTTGSPYYDSPVASIVIPSDFVCGQALVTGTGKKNHRK